MDIHGNGLGYLQQRRKFQCQNQKVGVTHTGNDVIEINFTRNFPLKTKGNGIDLVGFV